MSRRFRCVVLSLCPIMLAAIGAIPGGAAPTSITLHWTAPGDDGSLGKATRYDLRYSTRPQTTLSFTQAKAATGLPAPTPAGGQETYLLTGLASDSTYYIALKTADDAGNWSALSNVVVRFAGVLDATGDSSAFAFDRPWPNPAVHSLQLAYHLPRAGATQTQVFDIAGRVVRVLESGWHAAGVVALVWDLNDERGERVPTGVYFIFASALGRKWTRRVAVVQYRTAAAGRLRSRRAVSGNRQAWAVGFTPRPRHLFPADISIGRTSRRTPPCASREVRLRSRAQVSPGRSVDRTGEERDVSNGPLPRAAALSALTGCHRAHEHRSGSYLHPTALDRPGR
jgi:hypothetical protein